jgi:hypothetical protein
LSTAWCCRPRLAAKAASARGFSDSSGPLALHASGRIDSAAGLRRLLHGREAGTTAGGALALGRVRFCLFHVRSQMTVFVPPSLQTEAHDLKDLDNPGRANYLRSRAPKASTPNCSRRSSFQAETDCSCPKLNGPNGAGGAELGPQAGDRSRRRQFAASLSVPAGAFGSSAGDPAGASTSRSRSRCGQDLRIKNSESRPANPELRIAHHFSARPRWCLNLLSGGQTYPYLGHCITRGISLRRRANILRLGGVVRFWPPGLALRAARRRA